jgi:hypothetical protein
LKVGRPMQQRKKEYHHNPVKFVCQCSMRLMKAPSHTTAWNIGAQIFDESLANWN